MSRVTAELQKAAEAWGLTAGQDIIDIRGKAYITYVGILKHAHAQRDRLLRSVKISDPQFCEGQLWMRCTVEVQEANGEITTFEGVGDSFSTKKDLPPIRVTETRAKACALRTAYAIPFTGVEEMGEDFELEMESRPATKPPRQDVIREAAEAKEARSVEKAPSIVTGGSEREKAERILYTAEEGGSVGDVELEAALGVVFTTQAERDAWKVRYGVVAEEDAQLRKTSLAKIHACAKDAGLDHKGLKALLPAAWSLKTVPQNVLDAISDLLAARDLNRLRDVWSGYKMPVLDKLKDHMKARLSARAVLSSSTCKGERCGKQILWGVSEKQGTRTPVEMGPIRSLKGAGKGELFYILSSKGTLLLAHTYPLKDGEEGVQTYISHHSKCPNAPHFRAPKKEAA